MTQRMSHGNDTVFFVTVFSAWKTMYKQWQCLYRLVMIWRGQKYLFLKNDKGLCRIVSKDDANRIANIWFRYIFILLMFFMWNLGKLNSENIQWKLIEFCWVHRHNLNAFKRFFIWNYLCVDNFTRNHSWKPFYKPRLFSWNFEDVIREPPSSHDKRVERK